LGLNDYGSEREGKGKKKTELRSRTCTKQNEAYTNSNAIHHTRGKKNMSIQKLECDTTHSQNTELTPPTLDLKPT
jgi:hypothetical protein